MRQSASLEEGSKSDWPTGNQQVAYGCRTRKRPGMWARAER